MILAASASKLQVKPLLVASAVCLVLLPWEPAMGTAKSASSSSPAPVAQTAKPTAPSNSPASIAQTPKPASLNNSAPAQTAQPDSSAFRWLLILLGLLPVGVALWLYRLQQTSPVRRPTDSSKALDQSPPAAQAGSTHEQVNGRAAASDSHSPDSRSLRETLGLEQPVAVTPSPTAVPAEPLSATEVVAIQPQLESSTTRLAKLDVVEALVSDLHGADSAQRRQAIWELGQRGDSRAVQPLVDLLVDADSQQRSLILAALSEISARTLKPMHRALMVSLQDESPDVRKNAIRDITRIYDLMAQVSQLLQYAASDSDAEVQDTARWALGQLGRVRSTPQAGELPERD